MKQGIDSDKSEEKKQRNDFFLSDCFEYFMLWFLRVVYARDLGLARLRPNWPSELGFCAWMSAWVHNMKEPKL